MNNQKFAYQTAPRKISDAIHQMIRGGRWLAEGRVPPMRKLADEFGVSVTTVQSALQILQSQGLLETRDRSGVFINRSRYQATRSTLVGLLAPFKDASGEERRKESSRHHLPLSLDHDEWGAHINRAFEQTLRSHGLDLIGLPVVLESEEALVPTVGQRLDRLGTPLAGALFASVSYVRPLTKELDQRDVPWVTINPLSQQSVYNFVAADNMHGGKRVGRCLAGMGLRDVLVMCRSLESSQSDVEKVLGVYQGYLERGAPTDRIVVQRVDLPDESAGYRTMKTYLAEMGRRPEAVFSISDAMAIGAMRALREEGIRVPDDVGVIGATGLNLSTHSDPPLTTLAQPMTEMGHQAASMLTFMIREGVRRLVGRRIPGRLIFRESIHVPAALQKEAEQDFQETVDQLQAIAADAVDATIELKDAHRDTPPRDAATSSADA